MTTLNKNSFISRWMKPVKLLRKERYHFSSFIKPKDDNLLFLEYIKGLPRVNYIDGKFKSPFKRKRKESFLSLIKFLNGWGSEDEKSTDFNKYKDVLNNKFGINDTLEGRFDGF